MASKFELILKIGDDDGSSSIVSLGQICGGKIDDAALLGMDLSESKRLLTRLQHEIVTAQFKSISHERRPCACCGSTPTIKDYQKAKFRSLFGDVMLRVPRFVKCGCSGVTTSRISQRRWISAELECVQSELAARLSFRQSTDVLSMLLPIGKGHSASTVRARTLRVGKRLDAELTGPQAAQVHQSKVTTIGLDGGYVRHSDPGLGKNFEIIAGRVLAEDGSQRSVGFVRSVDKDSRTRVQHAVAALGGADDGLRVFTDGDGRLRDLQLAVLPDAIHVLDWFHLTCRLTILSSVISGKPAAAELEPHDQDRLSEWVESAKWRLWHGRAPGAIERLQDMVERMERLCKGKDNGKKKPALKCMLKHAKELQGYLQNNADSIPNYGQRYRDGERIATSFVESAVNQIIDKRMSKSQQMRWSPQSAHLLLQVRTSVLDGRLREDFARWYPGFAANDSTLQKQA